MSSGSNSATTAFGRAGDAAAASADAARRAGQEIGAATRTEFNNILSDLQDLAARAGKASGRELAVLREQMSDKLSVAKDKVGALTGDAADAARKGIDVTGRTIQGRPFQSVAVAAIVGFAIGMLVSRR
jgi:ElaB/YqjD/DUF883 family membrane-anchored ribosome-binding protein